MSSVLLVMNCLLVKDCPTFLPNGAQLILTVQKIGPRLFFIRLKLIGPHLVRRSGNTIHQRLPNSLTNLGPTNFRRLKLAGPKLVGRAGSTCHQRLPNNVTNLGVVDVGKIFRYVYY